MVATSVVATVPLTARDDVALEEAGVRFACYLPPGFSAQVIGTGPAQGTVEVWAHFGLPPAEARERFEAHVRRAIASSQPAPSGAESRTEAGFGQATVHVGEPDQWMADLLNRVGRPRVRSSRLLSP